MHYERHTQITEDIVQIEQVEPDVVHTLLFRERINAMADEAVAEIDEMTKRAKVELGLVRDESPAEPSAMAIWDQLNPWADMWLPLAPAAVQGQAVAAQRHTWPPLGLGGVGAALFGR